MSGIASHASSERPGGLRLAQHAASALIRLIGVALPLTVAMYSVDFITTPHFPAPVPYVSASLLGTVEEPVLDIATISIDPILHNRNAPFAEQFDVAVAANVCG